MNMGMRTDLSFAEQTQRAKERQRRFAAAAYVPPPPPEREPEPEVEVAPEPELPEAPIRTSAPSYPSIADHIIPIICAFYEQTAIDLVSQRRTADVVLPRQVGMYLAKLMTLHSLPVVGKQFGGRDHTTVLHAVRKMGGNPRKGIAGLIATDAQLGDEVRFLMDWISIYSGCNTTEETQP